MDLSERAKIKQDKELLKIVVMLKKRYLSVSFFMEL